MEEVEESLNREEGRYLRGERVFVKGEGSLVPINR